MYFTKTKCLIGDVTDGEIKGRRQGNEEYSSLIISKTYTSVKRDFEITKGACSDLSLGRDLPQTWVALF